MKRYQMEDETRLRQLRRQLDPNQRMGADDALRIACAADAKFEDTGNLVMKTKATVYIEFAELIERRACFDAACRALGVGAGAGAQA